MPSYDVALIVTIEAETYGLALREAEHLAEGISMTDELFCCAVFDYERDNDGQRVLYLPNEAPYSVGIVEDGNLMQRFDTLAQAESFLAALPQTDVANGRYFLDGPEREDA